MELRPGYKQTEVGVIPVEWDVAPLGRLVTSVEYGSAAKSCTRGLMPVLRMGNLQSGRIDWNDLVYTDDEQEIAKYALRPGDVLFNRTNTIDLVGKTSIYAGERPAIFAGYLIRVNVNKDKLDSRYLNYILNTELAKKYSLKVLSVAVSQANINGQKLKTYPVPLPPTTTEQSAIANALDDADALLAAQDALIAKKRAMKQGAMQELLTGKRRLPGFSGEWEVKRLGDHLEFLGKGANSRAELMNDGRVRYLHYGDIHGTNEVLLNPTITAMPFLPEAKAVRLDRLGDGDLVFADASEDLDGVGKSVELQSVGKFEVVSGMHTIAVRFDKGILADGFKAYLQFIPSFQTHLRRLASGTKVYATNMSHIASAEVKLPSPAEQVAISAVLTDMDAELTALEAQRAKTVQLKQGMMQALLTGRIRLV
ncbi:restriction endonuclease subunit S [Stenotrophomonas acidaminiphila]|uniref:restriction endonuclease subunit S n=1 Tax=Stenotrophomonas acidaminiphila TaxID=128780 RepID=UPI0028B2242D|nr:restriction endonuclease subunit S [Stenotrophomonas acidaminiphila]